MANPKYGDLIRLGPDDGEVSEVLKRVPLGAAASQAALAKVIFRNCCSVSQNASNRDNRRNLCGCCSNLPRVAYARRLR